MKNLRIIDPPVEYGKVYNTYKDGEHVVKDNITVRLDLGSDDWYGLAMYAVNGKEVAKDRFLGSPEDYVKKAKGDAELHTTLQNWYKGLY